MAVRDVIWTTRIVTRVHRVIEPELDMARLRGRQPPAVNIFRQLIRKLVPAGQSSVHSPMRSIARELEEAWPSSDL